MMKSKQDNDIFKQVWWQFKIWIDMNIQGFYNLWINFLNILGIYKHLQGSAPFLK